MTGVLRELAVYQESGRTWLPLLIRQRWHRDQVVREREAQEDECTDWQCLSSPLFTQYCINIQLMTEDKRFRARLRR